MIISIIIIIIIIDDWNSIAYVPANIVLLQTTT